ncbi:CA174 protein, partial [Aegotheles bennettii]|nr:CA174 protein [Aegotheles bennettii]
AASRKGADSRPSKRPKCDKTTPVKSEIEGLTSGSGNLAALGETPKPSDGNPCSEDPGDRNTTPEKKGESIPGTKEGQQGKEHNVPLEPCAVESSSVPPAVGSGGKLCNRACCSTDESCESVPSDGSGSEDGDLPKKPLQLDNSAFLDEDSNQPMPVARFFGDVQFIQDFPAAAVPSTAMSRREFRNLHFIAKEEEEEEEEEE